MGNEASRISLNLIGSKTAKDIKERARSYLKVCSHIKIETLSFSQTRKNMLRKTHDVSIKY